MGHTGFIINTFLDDFTPSYYFGAWDDAHTPGQSHVGLGWTLHGADCIEFGGFPKWKPLLRAYGRMPGNNAHDSRGDDFNEAQCTDLSFCGVSGFACPWQLAHGLHD